MGIVMYCNVLYCIVLYCMAGMGIVLYGMAWYGYCIVLYGMVWVLYCIVWHGMGIVLYCMVWHGMGMVRYGVYVMHKPPYMDILYISPWATLKGTHADQYQHTHSIRERRGRGKKSPHSCIYMYCITYCIIVSGSKQCRLVGA